MLRSTTDGDGVVAGPSPPQDGANRKKAVGKSTIHRYVRLEMLISLVCILRLEAIGDSNCSGANDDRRKLFSCLCRRSRSWQGLEFAQLHQRLFQQTLDAS